MNVIGHHVVDGVPFINGKKAIACKPNDPLVKMMNGALAPWKCPECDAHLAGGSLICLNACHLSAASLRRFQNGLAGAQRRTQK